MPVQNRTKAPCLRSCCRPERSPPFLNAFRPARWHRFFSLQVMESKNEKLREQEAPLKNHDKAFVQVGKDGEPVIPQTDEKKDEDRQENERTTTLDKR